MELGENKWVLATTKKQNKKNLGELWTQIFYVCTYNWYHEGKPEATEQHRQKPVGGSGCAQNIIDR